MADLTVAETIRQQLGAQAILMLGAHTFLGSETALTFRIRGSRKVNHIQIELDASDTYTVTFRKIGKHGLNIKTVSKVEHVHVETLHSVIRYATGLVTNL